MAGITAEYQSQNDSGENKKLGKRTRKYEY